MWNMADGASATALPALTDGALSVEEIMERALAAKGAGSAGSGGGGGKGGQQDRGTKRQREDHQANQGWPKKRTDSKGEIWVTNVHHVLASGKVPCKAFNTRNGCNNKHCQDAHVCAVKTGPKEICGQRGHSCVNHWESNR